MDETKKPKANDDNTIVKIAKALIPSSPKIDMTPVNSDHYKLIIHISSVLLYAWSVFQVSEIVKTWIISTVIFGITLTPGV